MDSAKASVRFSVAWATQRLYSRLPKTDNGSMNELNAVSVSCLSANMHVRSSRDELMYECRIRL